MCKCYIISTRQIKMDDNKQGKRESIKEWDHSLHITGEGHLQAERVKVCKYAKHTCTLWQRRRGPQISKAV